MTPRSENSVIQWLGDLKTNERGEAARLLWDRYFDRPARLAQARLRDVSRGPADGEDVALSVLESFFQGVATERFPDLGNREDLWPLLVTIAARKAHNQRRNERRQKRGGARVGGSLIMRKPARNGPPMVKGF